MTDLTLLGEWLSILKISKGLFGRLNTSGGVIKYPKNIKRVVRKKFDTSGEVVRPPISKIVVRKYFVMLRKCINVRSGDILFRFMISQGASDCLHSRRSRLSGMCKGNSFSFDR